MHVFKEFTHAKSSCGDNVQKYWLGTANYLLSGVLRLSQAHGN